MKEIKVSVIIPVYNVEQYIERCLNSIINQTLKEIEIIVIDDGSKDNSKNIISDMCKKDNRIYFISRENKGVGPTRNEAIEIANGEYILFVDSDDTIEKDMCEKMYQTAKLKNADIVVCDKNIIQDEKIINIKGNKRNMYIEISSVGDFIKKYYYTGEYENHVWDKMFRLSIVKDNEIKFGDLKEITGEDLFFGITILPYVKKVSFIPDKLYNYFIRENSIMTTYRPQELKKTIEFMRKLDEFQQKKKLEKMYDSFLATYVYYLAISASKESIKYKKLKKLKDDLKIMVEDIVVRRYAELLQDKENFKAYKNKLKEIFAKKLAKYVIKKKIRHLYCLLILKYYI